jgi:heme oxygenase
LSFEFIILPASMSNSRIRCKMNVSIIIAFHQDKDLLCMSAQEYKNKRAFLKHLNRLILLKTKKCLKLYIEMTTENRWSIICMH